jgi:hypothetical protein
MAKETPYADAYFPQAPSEEDQYDWLRILAPNENPDNVTLGRDSRGRLTVNGIYYRDEDVQSAVRQAHAEAAEKQKDRADNNAIANLMAQGISEEDAVDLVNQNSEVKRKAIQLSLEQKKLNLREIAYKQDEVASSMENKDLLYDALSEIAQVDTKGRDARTELESIMNRYGADLITDPVHGEKFIKMYNAAKTQQGADEKALTEIMKVNGVDILPDDLWNEDGSIDKDRQQEIMKEGKQRLAAEALAEAHDKAKAGGEGSREAAQEYSDVEAEAAARKAAAIKAAELPGEVELEKEKKKADLQAAEEVRMGKLQQAADAASASKKPKPSTDEGESGDEGAGEQESQAQAPAPSTDARQGLRERLEGYRQGQSAEEDRPSMSSFMKSSKQAMIDESSDEDEATV